MNKMYIICENIIYFLAFYLLTLENAVYDNQAIVLLKYVDIVFF